MNQNELEGLPFQNVTNLQEVLVIEPKIEDSVVIGSLENTKIDLKFKKSMEQIVDFIRHIEAKGVIDLTRTNIMYHTIEVVPGTQPIKQKRRPVPPNYMDAFKKSIIEMEEAGLIEPARSPWCSPIHIVRKEDGSIRIAQDYKKLNAVTIKDAYPLPNISNMFCKLSKARIFTKLDLMHGYLQIMLDEASRQFTALHVNWDFFNLKCFQWV
jgi:hypothetical protein